MSFKELKVEFIGDKKVAENLEEYGNNIRGFVKIGEKKWFVPRRYLDFGDRIYNFETRPNDIWIITHPRSGTTLTQEIIWLVTNDLNFDEALRMSLLDRFPFLDISIVVEADLFSSNELERWSTKSIEFVQGLPSPRFIKSHFPLELLPTVVNSDCKVVYVARNPKDVAVSWYHFQKNYEGISYQGTLDQFCGLFMNDCTLYAPYWEHVKTAWAKRHRPNTLFLFYEDLVKDLLGNSKKIAAFFGKSYSDEQYAKLTEHLTIEKFRANPMVNKPTGGINMKPDVFVRQGKVGGWKELFTPEIEEKFDKWIADNLKDTDLTFRD